MSNEKGPVSPGPKSKHNQSIATRPAGQVPVVRPAIADEMNDNHRQFVAAMLSGLERAKHIGGLLLKVKEDCPHGEWLKWVAENLEFSEDTAQGYMRITKCWPEIEAANTEDVRYLTYTGALKLLAGPKKSATEADSEPLPLPFGFQPKTGTALVGCDTERKLVVVVASESVTHKGYWHISALDTDGHAIVAYMLPIESVWLTEALGTVMEESGLRAWRY